MREFLVKIIAMDEENSPGWAFFLQQIKMKQGRG